jgi:hypothetical protein
MAAMASPTMIKMRDMAHDVARQRRKAKPSAVCAVFSQSAVAKRETGRAWRARFGP